LPIQAMVRGSPQCVTTVPPTARDSTGTSPDGVAMRVPVAKQINSVPPAPLSCRPKAPGLLMSRKVKTGVSPFSIVSVVPLKLVV
jgi:hypothetical protein